MLARRWPVVGEVCPSGASRFRALASWALALSLLAVPTAAQSPETLAAIEAAETYLVARLSEPVPTLTPPPLFDRDSAVALRALAEGGRTDPPVATALVRLTGAPLATAEPAALRALALAAAARPGPPVSDLLAFANGSGMGAVTGHHSNLFDTALVVEALALEEAARLVELADLASWLVANANPDGGWGFVPGDASSVYATARVLLALGRLEALVVDPAAIAAAQSFVVSRQQADGGFGTTLDTALAWRALLASGFDPTGLATSPASALLARQLPDGSFEGEVLTTAQALLALRLDLPDLAVTDVVADPSSVTGGGPLKLRVTVANRGPADAPSTRLGVLAEATGEPLGSATIPTLAAGEETALEVQLVTPAGSGELSLEVVADADDEVPERSETDNRRSLRVDLVLPPDLAVFASDLAVSPPRPLPGEPASLLVAVRNLGEEEIALFSYQVTEILDGVAGNLLAEGSAGPASPGAGVLLEVPLSLPEGEHHLLVELDPDGAIPEGDESNNRAETMLLVADDRLADLAVDETGIRVTPERPAVGEPVTVEATVSNLGSVDASARVELLEATASGGGGLLAGEVVTLAAGSSTVLTASFAAGAETVAVTVAADPDDAVVELSEANNRARRFLVDLPDPAIGFDHLDLVPRQPLVGETVSGTLTVRNAGSLPAPLVPVAVFAGDPAAGVEIFRGEVRDIAPGGNRSLSFSWTAVEGRTAVTAVADPDGLVEELSETNNRQVREVLVPRATGPDLAVEAVDLSAYTQDPAELAASGTVGLTIANPGDAASAGETSVRLFEDVDGDLRFGSPDRLLATAVVPVLAAGASTEVALAVDAVLAFHRPLLVAELDPSDLVAERDESDNRVPVLVSCEEPPAVPSLEPLLEWSVGDLEVESTPVVVQLTDDTGDGVVDGRDTPDVAFHAEDGGGPVVVAVSGADGSRLWTFRSSLAHPLASRLAHLAAGDLDGDGVAELVAVQRDGRLLALDHRGRALWTSDAVGTIGGFQWAGGAALGDLTGDGAPEIALGRSVLSNRGELLAVGTGNIGRAANAFGPFGAPFLIDVPLSIIADVDLDGRNELVAGDTLYRMEAGRLEIVWDHEVEDLLMIDGLSAVAQLDADPEAEIVYVSSGWALVLEHDGTVASGPRRIIRGLTSRGRRPRAPARPARCTRGCWSRPARSPAWRFEGGLER